MLKPKSVNKYLLVLNIGNRWVAGGWDDDITSDDWDHSREFPAFSTSKNSSPIGWSALFLGAVSSRPRHVQRHAVRRASTRVAGFFGPPHRSPSDWNAKWGVQQRKLAVSPGKMKDLTSQTELSRTKISGFDVHKKVRNKQLADRWIVWG